MFGVDYAFSPHPSVSALKSAKVGFVGRYIGSKDYTKSRSAKWLNPTEYRALKAAGIPVYLYFEVGAKRAEGGHAAGVADAQIALKEMQYCGVPAGMPVYFCVDYDTTVGPNITGYFQGVASVLGLKRTGAYGGYKVIKVLFDKKLITYGCQTLAWSGGNWDSRAQLQQYEINKTVGGADVDYVRSVKSDFGQDKAVAPTPKPSSGPKPWPGEYYKLTSPLTHDSNVQWIQQRLNAHGAKLTVDSEFGPLTEKAVKAFQKSHKLTVDGIVGKNTWTALGK
jgi:hypothetical protein